MNEYLDELTARASGLAEGAEDARTARRRLGGGLGYLGWLARRYGERPNLVARLWPALDRVEPQLAGWLLLALATLLAASAAGRRALGAAEAPYCDFCDRWCERLELVAGRGLLPRLAELLPDLREKLLGRRGRAALAELRLDACPDCLETAFLTVRDPARLPGRRTRLCERELSGRELRALRRLYRAPPPPAGAPDETPAPPGPPPAALLFEYYERRYALHARLERWLGRAGGVLLALGLPLALLAPADAARAEVGWPPAGGFLLAGLILFLGRLGWGWLWRGRMLARWRETGS